MLTAVALLRQYLWSWGVGPELPGPVEQSFREHCSRSFDQQSRIVAAVVLSCVLVWWPFDHLVFSAYPNLIAIVSRCRLLLTLTLSIFLFLPRPPAAIRHMVWPFSLVSFICCSLAGYAAGEMGGFNEHYFHMLCLIVMAPIILPLRLGPRTLLTFAIAAATVAGTTLPFPQSLHSPYFGLGISWMIFVSLLGISFGQVLFVRARENFWQAHKLAEYGRLLESRVDERTRELRSLLFRVEKAREDERTRVARELHDELGQELSALRYSLGFTRQRYEKDPTAITANLDDLESLLQRTATSTRNLVAELRPRVLDDLGLAAATQWLLERTEQRSALHCQLSVEGDLEKLDTRVATAAFRVLQEALNNTVRHAEAQRVAVAVTARDGQLELRVTDDGIGLSVASKRANRSGSHVGLIGMRERGQSLGGQVQVSECDNGGTEVFCRLPLQPTLDDPATEDSNAS